ncbi:MAG TPA: hypothetical protein VI078_02160 [bacterium]
MPGAAAAPKNLERVLPAVGETEIGPGALVNTLGLRSARKAVAGRYVTIADGQRLLRTRVANQLFAEFGVFRDEQGRFRLLGADGRWVSLRLSTARHRYEVGTWAGRWSAAWSFRLTRPATVPAAVLGELTAAGIDSRQVLCVLAYSPFGAPRGLLATSDTGVMQLNPAGVCGASTATLFITDSVRKGADPAALVRGVRIDPVTFVRFVPPDGPALTLSLDDRRLMRNEVIAYFDMLASYNDFLLNDIRDAVWRTTEGLLTTSYTIPGDKAKEINLADFFVKRASYALDLIPVYGTIASGVLKATYDTVELGIAIAHNANLAGPRVVESVTNEVLHTAIEIQNEYNVAYSHFGRNLEKMRNATLEGCTDPAACTSDRKLVAWLQADPMKNVTADVARLTRETEVALQEVAIWQRLLPIRGLLWAHPDLQYMPRQASSTNCDPGYPLNSAFRNDDVLDHYVTWATGTGHPALGVPLVTTAVYYPYYNWYQPGWCAGTDVHRAYRQGWILGLANDDASAVTPLGTALARRLFAPWNPDDPVGSGFGLSRADVACGWLTNRARGYMGRAGYYFDPCHFAFTDVGGSNVSPHEGESPYLAAWAWTVSFWTPAPGEVAAGRQQTDPDVTSPLVPNLDFGSCAAFQAGSTKSVAGGAAVKVYFTNLYDGAIDIYRIRTDGATRLAFTLARQDQLARPLGGDNQKGPLHLRYSSLVNTTAGMSFLVRKHGSGECIGTWTARALPAGAPVGYSVAEVHGDNTVLY